MLRCSVVLLISQYIEADILLGWCGYFAAHSHPRLVLCIQNKQKARMGVLLVSNWQGEYKNVSAKTYIASRKCFFPQNIKKSRHNCKKTLNKRFFGLATTSRLQCAGVSPGLGWSSEKMPVSSWASALVLSAPSFHTELNLANNQLSLPQNCERSVKL